MPTNRSALRPAEEGDEMIGGEKVIDFASIKAPKTFTTEILSASHYILRENADKGERVCSQYPCFFITYIWKAFEIRSLSSGRCRQRGSFCLHTRMIYLIVSSLIIQRRSTALGRCFIDYGKCMNDTFLKQAPRRSRPGSPKKRAYLAAMFH